MKPNTAVPCANCVWSNGSCFEKNEEKTSETERVLKLKEIFNLLYGDIFPEPIKIKLNASLGKNSIILVFGPNWEGKFTYNGPRDFQLIF